MPPDCTLVGCDNSLAWLLLPAQRFAALLGRGVARPSAMKSFDPSGDLEMFGIGTTELMIIGIICLLLFGNRLPSMMRGLGQGLSEFKRGLHGIDEEIRKEP
jgi:sec-independent protein translocase protein TatA